MIKKTILIAFAFCTSLTVAQQVTLSKADKISDTKDKFLYKVDSASNDKVYLGELEIEGYVRNEPKVFEAIYKKAKSIGANGFELKALETIDQTPYQINPTHFFLNLYELNEKPLRDNKVYLISAAEKPVKVRLNNKTVVLEPRSFIESKLEPGELNSVGVGKLLGSKISLTYKEGQPVQYFLILPAGVRANSITMEGGINFKSGDIISVERSYAEFLTTIYRQQK